MSTSQQSVVPATNAKEYFVVQSYNMNYKSSNNNPDDSVEFTGYSRTYNVKNDKAYLTQHQTVTGRLKPDNLYSVFDTGFSQKQDLAWKPQKRSR